MIVMRTVQIALLLGALSLAAIPLGAQAKQPAFSYDAASVKPNTTGSGSTHLDVNTDRFQGTNLSLTMLLQFAYDLKSEEQIAGLPPWAKSSRFDVQAKVDAEMLARLKALTPQENRQARRAMLQGVLAERFQLQVHRETRELPLYALVVAKSGLKIKPADPNDTYANGPKSSDGTPRGAGSLSTSNGEMTAQAIPLADLATFLSSQLRRHVENKTGLTGKYDWTLKWTRDDLNSPDSGAAESAPGLFTALQEQLGLRLEAMKGPVETIVIDHSTLR